jgi:hypothetical protein
MRVKENPWASRLAAACGVIGLPWGTLMLPTCLSIIHHCAPRTSLIWGVGCVSLVASAWYESFLAYQHRRKRRETLRKSNWGGPHLHKAFRAIYVHQPALAAGFFVLLLAWIGDCASCSISANCRADVAMAVAGPALAFGLARSYRRFGTLLPPIT